ncbi:MAG: hypothetical protein HRF43_19240 [Phycisphaerae bacterium]|jgi:hypothetical protein
MNTVRWAAAASLCWAGQVFAASIVNFQVELAPYNAAYVQAWKSGARIMFPPGSPASGQEFLVGSIITWDVVVALDPNGLHNQPGHPSHNFKPYGLANIVFNLELQDANGAKVNTGQFYSAINNGTGGDPVAAAAFALSFNYAARGPGRIIDQVSDLTPPNGGPNLPLFTYPTLVASEGKLLGQGAGYTQWRRTAAGNAVITIPGVGLVTLPNGSPGLGLVPICEGQLDTSNMAPGTYQLKVVPGAGVNVLRGDYPDFMSNDKDAFAVAANEVYGSTISFTLTTTPPGCQEPPVIVGAASVRTHGSGVGPLALPINLAGPVTVEPRDGGPQQIVVTYDQAIAPSDGTLDTEVTLSTGTLNGVPVIADHTLTIPVTGVADATCLAVTISGITCQQGGAVAPPSVLRLIAQKGDVNGNGVVNSTDIAITKSRSGLAVTEATAGTDVNLSGAINSTDIAIVKSLSGGPVAPACP